MTCAAARLHARLSEQGGSSMSRRKILVADLLCGAGGSSTGCARALRELGLEMELDDRFHESCHNRGIHPRFGTPI
jgi:hypothetical protein